MFAWVAKNHRKARAASTAAALAFPLAAALAQGVPATLQPAPGSRTDLAALLGAPAEPPLTPDLRAALVASRGQPAVGWALALATDTSGATSLAVRAGALRVLRYARWRGAIPTLVRLAQPYHAPWVVWHGALAALASYPFPELAGFWKEQLQFPRRPVREIAVLGLARTGTVRDRAAIGEAWHGERDPWILRLRERAESLLAMPVAARDTAVFAWPPDSAGRFVPSRSWLDALKRRLCRSPEACARR